MTSSGVRSDFSVALSVWKALFLREASARLSTGRAAWLWIVLEPAVHLIFLMLLFGAIRHRLPTGGADPEMFILVGVWGFFLARNVAGRGMEAVNANAALFAYRQVRPVDTVLVRAALEAFLYLAVWFVLLAGLAMFDIDVAPSDPVLVALSAALLWLLGLGMALVFSVLGALLPELAKIIRLSFTPLYFLSAVMYPVASVPRPLRDLLLLNPILHGLESMRAGYFSGYHGEKHISLTYLTFVMLSMVFLGLALHTRYAQRLVAQ
jgi:capsular polysaccharide transport system permease protein